LIADGSSFLKEVTAHDSTFTDSTAVPGENYYYCIRSSDGDHLGLQSSVALGRTLAVTGGFETGVYYYPWYGPTEGMHGWDGEYTRDYLIPRQPPMLGHYSSRDPVIIRQHLNWMKTCGIDFMVMSWWGIESREDITLHDHILGELADTSIKFSIYYESAILGLDQGQILIDQSNEGLLIADFNYIADTYFGHPNYLRINDKPVIFIYLSGIYSGNFKEAFTRVRLEMSARGYEVFLVGDEVGWGETSVSHMDFLDAVSPYIVLPRQIQQGEYPGNGDFFADLSVQAGEWEKAARTAGRFVIPSVIPGFNNRSVSGSGFAVPRQTYEGGTGTSMLEEYIKVMLPFIEPEHKMVMITSWNEWHEDTQVEPTIVTSSTDQDVSAGGDYYTWDYTYEGYGNKNLKVIRRLLASELPDTDFTTHIRSSIKEPGELEIYPNPTKGLVNIEIGEQGSYQIEITSLNGQVLYSKMITESIHQIDLSAFRNGLYLITIKSNKFFTTRRISKH
jgi:hypothetical protein